MNARLGLAPQAHGARANGLGLPVAGPELVALRDQILRPNVEPSRAGWRFRPVGGAPLLFAWVKIKRIPSFERILEHPPADLMAQRHARVAVGQFEAVGIIK